MHPYGKPGDPHYPPKSPGLSRYQSMGQGNPNMPAPEMHEGTLESARRSGMQPQPDSMKLMELLRKLGIL